MDNQTLITDLILKAGLSKIRSGALHATQKAKINTIEDFWRMYYNIYSVEELIPNTDFMLFKKGIRPEWEDP